MKKEKDMVSIKAMLDIERFGNFTLTCLHHVSINYVRSYLESNAFNIAANAILDGRTL